MKTLVLCLVALVAMSAGGALASHPDPSLSTGGEPVFVDTTDILYLESYPVQVRLAVAGSLPSPCHELAWDVLRSDERLDVRLWSQVTGAGMCAAVLEPFEVSIALGSFESASLPVFLNGEQVGRVEVGSPPGTPSDWLTGAGWSFGMCMGYCDADLTIGADGPVVLAGTDRARNVTLFTNPGTLTSDGRERVQEAVAELVGVPLSDVYGCPDCADGGAAYLAVEQDGMVSRHDMEFGNPPPELAELHALAMELIEALQDCESGDLVVVNAECQAWEGAS